MKICKDCDFFEVREVQLNHEVPLCVHSECRNVITGTPILAMEARQLEFYCGFKAKHFKEKPKGKDVEDAQIIQLSDRKG